jgi:hypothetical protein
MNLHDTMEWIVTGFEFTGVAILVLGSLVALVSAAAMLRRGHPRGQQDDQFAATMPIAAPPSWVPPTSTRERVSAERFSWASKS